MNIYKSLNRITLIFLAILFGIFGWAENSRAAIPSSLGWYQIPISNLRSVCPPNGFGGSGYNFYDYCQGITEAWNGGVFDSQRNRFIIWGGGHNDYYGNEIYALSLDTLVLQRITNPGLPLADRFLDSYSACTDAIANGTQPNSRHTYDGIEYMPNVDRMFVFGGAQACRPGSFNTGTWTFNFSTNTWEKKNPSGIIPRPDPGVVTAYDSNTGKIFLHDNNYLYSYDFNSNNYQQLSDYNYVDYHMTGVIDPVRKKFVMIGGGQQWIYDISSGSLYAIQNLSSTGGSAIVNASSPGLAYDPISDRIIAWSGGNIVYSLNLDTKVWAAISSYSGGPGVAIPAGTFGRWQYSPTSGVFVTLNNVDANAFTFRLISGTTPSDTTPPSVPTNLTANVISSSQINLSWTASTDNIGVTGYRIYRGGVQVGTSATNSYSDTGLSPSTSYTYNVAAYDAVGNISGQSISINATTNFNVLSYGLEWPGDGAVRRMLYWSNPFPIYDATYIFKVYPRKKTIPPDQSGYYTTFFWGNNGTFIWDGGNANTYYGTHPYPIPAPNGPGQWEISVYGNDIVTGSEVQWNRWYTQVIRVWRESLSITHHEFYWDWPDMSKKLEYTINNPTWANQNPPTPAIVIGQTPNLNGMSWGGYPGWEEFKGIIRGVQMYSNDLSLADIQSELNSPKSTVAGQSAIWYLNINPRPSDVTDKKGVGIAHNPSWDGTTALEWAEQTLPSDTTAPAAPTGLSVN